MTKARELFERAYDMLPSEPISHPDEFAKALSLCFEELDHLEFARKLDAICSAVWCRAFDMDTRECSERCVGGQLFEAIYRQGRHDGVAACYQEEEVA